MNKSIKYFSIVIITVVVIMIIGILTWQTKMPATPTPTFTPIVSGSPIPTLTPDTTEDWKEYTNKVLGFSMWLPKKVVGEDNKFVALNIFEDNKNNVIYFGTSIGLSTKDGWRLKVAVKSVKNDSELEKFIKEKFGSDCKIDKRSYLYGADNEAVYSYEQTPGGIESNCAVAKILYDSRVKKVMAISGAQECRFSATLDNYGAVCYDDLMINSFRFE